MINKKYISVAIVLIVVLFIAAIILVPRAMQTKTPQQIIEPPKSEIPNVPDISDCTSKVIANRQAGIDFAATHVVVGFKEHTTIDQAKDILVKYNISSNINRYEITPDIYIWTEEPFVVAYVEAGKEAEWICKLRTDAGIRYAELDSIGSAA